MAQWLKRSAWCQEESEVNLEFFGLFYDGVWSVPVMLERRVKL